jgi:GAF domain-containing protein/anti-sigma regulatory factor (Ser/Thr protein kinase)
MRRGAKPAKSKVAKLPVARKSPKSDGARVRDLEKRLAESLEREKAKDRALAEALEQQTATAEILRMISRSPMNVRPVFEAIANSAFTLCAAKFVVVFTVQNGMLEIAAMNNISPAGIEALHRAYPMPVGTTGAASRAALMGRVVNIPDVFEDSDYGLRGVAEAIGLRSITGVPMIRDGQVIGVITVPRAETGGLSATQIKLLQTFADQAVIAVENVRLFNETKESLQQQTATAEILRVISSSPTDIQPVLQAVTENASRLCRAANVSLYRVEGDLMRKVAEHEEGPQLTSLRVGETRPITRTSVSGRAIIDRAVIHVRENQSPEAALEFPDGARRDTGIRTTIGFPLLREGSAIGAFTVYRTEHRPFTEGEIALLQTFADQAVIAIENVRLFKELEARNRDLTEALEQQTATGEVLKVISRSTFDLQPMLDTLIENAARLCGARRGVILRRDGDSYHGVAFYNASPKLVDFIRRHPVTPGRYSITARVVLERRTIHVADLQADPEYSYALRDIDPIRTELGVPMFRGDDLLGVIILYKLEVQPFSDKQIELVTTFADQAVIAIENVRLFKELESRNSDLTTALDRQTATADVLRIIAQSPTELQPVLDAIATSAMRLCAASDAVIERLEGDRFYNAAHAGAQMKGLVGLPLPLTRRFPGGRAILDREPVILDDIQLVAEREYPDTLELLKLNTIHSVAEIPLLSEGKPLGSLAVLRAEVRPFTAAEVTLLKTFADQAVIAIENVRLFTELQASNRDLTTALDKQTATSDILRVISQSQTDVQPVFDAILDSAVRLLRASSGTLSRLSGDLIDLAALTSTDPAGDDAVRATFPRPLMSDNPHARAIQGRVPLNITDVHTDPFWAEPLARLRGYRSVVAVPLLRQNESIGAITVTRREPGGFTEDEIALLQTFADQAVIAIENARLLSELQARTGELTRSVERLTALGEVGRAVSSTLDLETVLTTIVSRAVELSRADGGSMYEYDEAAEEFRLRASYRLDDPDLNLRREIRIKKGEGAAGQLAVSREPVQIPDITMQGAYDSRLRGALLRAGARAVLAVPLLREEHLIGGLVVSRNTPGEFPPEAVELLRTFATQSALAIQNARLFREIEDKSRELEIASQHKSEFLANMSHELRTPLNAIIGFSEVLSERMFGELNEKQEEYLKDIYASGTHLLSLINDILDLSKIEAGRMELELSDFHLPTALDSSLTLVRERAGRRSLTLHTDIDSRLGEIRADERKIRQVVLNLLSNAIKFTPEGGRIEVAAVPKDGFVEVSVSDTGVGIAPADQEAVFEEFRQVGATEKKAEGTGLGLTLCRKFVELHGGRIRVESQVGVGSTFTFTIPVRSAE